MRAGSEPSSWRWSEPLDPLIQCLESGGILAIPTESSYGLAVDPRNVEAVARIFELKGRPAAKPLPVVGASLDQLADLGIDRSAPVLSVAARMWPAALTAIVPLRVPIAASLGNATLAIRVPAHSRLRRLLADIGSPLTATSANASGESPLTTPSQLVEWIRTRPAGGAQVLIVDDGDLPGGEPSTLIEWAGKVESSGADEVNDRIRMLRVGAIPAASIFDMAVDSNVV